MDGAKAIIQPGVALPLGFEQAPELVTSEMVANMNAGSVTVDLAAANGGNIGTTVKDQVIVTENG